MEPLRLALSQPYSTSLSPVQVFKKEFELFIKKLDPYIKLDSFQWNEIVKKWNAENFYHVKNLIFQWLKSRFHSMTNDFDVISEKLYKDMQEHSELDFLTFGLLYRSKKGTDCLTLQTSERIFKKWKKFIGAQFKILKKHIHFFQQTPVFTSDIWKTIFSYCSSIDHKNVRLLHQTIFVAWTEYFMPISQILNEISPIIHQVLPKNLKPYLKNSTFKPNEVVCHSIRHTIMSTFLQPAIYHMAKQNLGIILVNNLVSVFYKNFQSPKILSQNIFEIELPCSLPFSVCADPFQHRKSDLAITCKHLIVDNTTIRTPSFADTIERITVFYPRPCSKLNIAFGDQKFPCVKFLHLQQQRIIPPTIFEILPSLEKIYIPLEFSNGKECESSIQKLIEYT